MVAFSKIAVAAFAGYAVAHPGEKHNAGHMKRELAARDVAAQVGARSLAACSNKPHARALNQRSVTRRAQKVSDIRKQRGIATAPRKNKRELADVQKWEAVNHNMSSVYDHDMFTPLEDVFGANTSCILAPEVTNGPYYVVGEYLRSNVKESESCDGIDMYLEVQYIDTNTCEPIPTVAVDVWNCNATGVYSGVAATGQAGVNSTFLRGIQLTDHDGVASFQTIFPGHYDGRAIHTHLMAHVNAQVQPNGTISVWNAPVAHIGQLFYPDDLREEVEATYPYTLNTQAVTTNDEDMWSIVSADANFDPFPQFLYLGDSIEDGLFAWIQIGINGSADYTDDDYYSIAAYLDEDGGHSTGDSVGGGDAPPGGNGTFPSGTDVPTGAPPTSTSA